MKTKKKLWKKVVCVAVSGLLCAAIIVADCICYQPGMYQTITSYTTGGMQTTDLKAKNAAYAHATTVGKSIEDEGIILLKNKDNSLPLKNVTKVNLFGVMSANLYISGGGSGSAKTDGVDVATLKDSFNQVGIQINDDLFNKYKQSKTMVNNGFSKTAVIKEPAITDQNYYSDALWKQYKSFSDVAVFVIGRQGSEGADFAHGSLSLTTTEKALLAQIEQRFSQVYVLINSGNAMELGFLNDSKINGALSIGFPGYQGALEVGKIMTGKVNPSGKTADIYAYDSSTSPSYNCSGIEATRQYTGIANDPDHHNGSYYIDYKEGIYVGYRYYETAATDGYINYNKTVQYPFGYGLSYTTFSEKIVSCSPSNGGDLSTKGSSDITVKVQVTNTGSVAGKDAVQLYDTPPYTKGGIEKSSVDLVAFGKTGELKPGASETVTLTFQTQDLASYDYNDANKDGHKGYEMDPGKYVLSVRSDSHTVLDSVALNCNSIVHFDTDTTTGATIKNLFDDANGSSETTPVTYLSRSNWAGTWPKSDGGTSTVSGTAYMQVRNMVKGRAASKTDLENTYDYYAAHYGDKDDKTVQAPTTGAKNGLTIKDMTGLKFDDKKWNKLLDELSVDDMEKLIGTGGNGVIALKSIGLSQMAAHDGPATISASYQYNGGKSSLVNYCYPNETVLASTWNTNLAYQMGLSVGTEAKVASIAIWWAPGMDLHRNQYGGRNFEYYSEDGLLSGKIGANEVKGCGDKGLIAEVKHFALNDQETCRNVNGLYTWVNEQAMREVYLKAFELTTKEGNCKAYMAGFNRIGAVWCGASKALMTDLLRNQWGFRGMVETDAYALSQDSTRYANMNLGIRTGTDFWLQIMSSDTPTTQINSAASEVAMRNACHDILYAVCNGTVINQGYPVWSICLIAGQTVIFILLALYIFFTFFHKSKRKNISDEESSIHKNMTANN